ncbi:MAG: hypothetical protein IJ061_10290 [Lachnospiraceae bacterium]|nr:hypothetical protein [Lachnospiraceae bacterium]
MKKITLLAALAAAAVLAACGSKQTENVPTQSAAPAETQAAGPLTDAIAESKPDVSAADTQVSVSLPEEYDQQFFEGVVSGYEGNVLTVDGTSSMSFDISAVEEDDESLIVRGCYVEVIYADAAESGVYPAEAVTVLNDNEQLAQQEERDPVIFGKLQYMDINEISLVDDAGRTLEFDGAIARKVSFGEIKPGDEVRITYAGTINKSEEAGDDAGIFSGTPFALKVVALDALKSEDAEANYVDGVISTIDGTSMTLSSPITDFECSAADASVFSGLAEEQKIRAYYSGSLTDIVLNITKVEQQ